MISYRMIDWYVHLNFIYFVLFAFDYKNSYHPINSVHVCCQMSAKCIINNQHQQQYIHIIHNIFMNQTQSR